MKLSEAVAIFLDAKAAEVGSLETVVWYRRKLRRLVEFVGDCPLCEVETMTVRLFIVSLRQRGPLYHGHRFREEREGTLAPATVHGYVRAVRQFLGWLG